MAATLASPGIAVLAFVLGAQSDDAFDLDPEAPPPDDAFDLDVDVAEPAPPSPWALTGFLRSDWHLWSERLEANPFAKGRQSADLVFSGREGRYRVLAHVHGEYDVAYRVERGTYDEATLDAYEAVLDTREVLAAASFGDFELTLGRQIVAWGEGDLASPLDVVNPRDLREPGLADLDDLRLPVLATRLGWFRGPHRLEAMAVHESDFGYRSPPRGPFSPFDAFVADAIRANPAAGALLASKEFAFEHEQARFSIDQQQLFLRWVYKGSGLDVGVHAASVLDPAGVVSVDVEEVLASDRAVLHLDHRRYELVGVSAALPAFPADELLWKGELVFSRGRPFTTGDSGDPTSLGAARSDTVDLLAGLTWSPGSATTVALEVEKPWLLDAPEGLLYEADTPLLALRASSRFLRDRLVASAAAIAFGFTAELGWLARAELSWELADALQVSGGYVAFHPTGDFSPLYGLTTHDRLFAALRWDFRVF